MCLGCLKRTSLNPSSSHVCFITITFLNMRHVITETNNSLRQLLLFLRSTSLFFHTLLFSGASLSCLEIICQDFKNRIPLTLCNIVYEHWVVTAMIFLQNIIKDTMFFVPWGVWTSRRIEDMGSTSNECPMNKNELKSRLIIQGKEFFMEQLLQLCLRRDKELSVLAPSCYSACLQLSLTPELSPMFSCSSFLPQPPSESPPTSF